MCIGTHETENQTDKMVQVSVFRRIRAYECRRRIVPSMGAIGVVVTLVLPKH